MYDKKMDDKKRLEITTKLLTVMFREKEFSFANLKRNKGNIAKAIDESPEAVGEVMVPILHNLSDEIR